MMHPHTELRFIDESIGYGVFATQLIPKGTITWILDELDQKFDEAYVMSLDLLLRDRLLKYCFRDEHGQYILCWDIARYVNHSFNSTLIATPYNFELAATDIFPGDEITDDYGYFNLDKPFHCLPEPNTTRTTVMPDDMLHYYAEWDHKASEAMRHFNSVKQPLRHLIDPAHSEKVNAIAVGKEAIDSILTCYYHTPDQLKAVKAAS
ncbi:SET domain-containing protein [Phormidium sp. CLA17]|uniref:SET domain-containing protein n=1 Tax=Leptolyngbya sp. Cla-17 TaxID=2803751 RepID=UPI001492018C|nr:SET domain-containing protein [Leptolyngbya sp. Cla-17]MBM0742692.1 SET domain-containing protein [Leptolyngbya sp. Cla-17]